MKSAISAIAKAAQYLLTAIGLAIAVAGIAVALYLFICLAEVFAILALVLFGWLIPVGLFVGILFLIYYISEFVNWARNPKAWREQRAEEKRRREALRSYVSTYRHEPDEASTGAADATPTDYPGPGDYGPTPGYTGGGV